jgi:Protein of unknown function (DUF3761)
MRRIGIRIAVFSTCLAFAPSFVFAQEAATVTCKDGSTGKAGKGACSHHGGVNKGAPAPASTGAPPPAAHKAPANDNAAPPAATQRSSPPPSRSAPAAKAAPGQPTAKCKDGSMSFSTHHSGACSHHGGVGQWLDGTQ